MQDPQNTSEPRLCVDDVLVTAELARRPARERDYAAENRALAVLAQEMAQRPDRVLHRLAELAMELCRADSAGISVLEPGGEGGMFRWRAAAGAFAPNLYGTMPHDASPCSTVIARNEALLFNEGERFFPALRGVEPRIYENLLVPWAVNGEPIGTIWVIKHTPDGRFDAEDARLLESLSRFASAAHQMVTALQSAQAGQEMLGQKVEELTRAEIALRESAEQQAAEIESLRRLHTLAMQSVTNDNLEGILGEIVETAIAIAHADFGNIQLLDPHSGDLQIAAQRGFPQWWIDYWQTSSKGHGVCGTALEVNQRVIVEDVLQSPIFTSTALQMQIDAGVRAVQSTPIVSRAGQILGMFSTHYKNQHRPSEQELQFLDLLARQAGDIIDHLRTATTLRESEERLRLVVEGARDYAIFTTDPEGVILDWYPGAAGVFGYAAQGIQGRHVELLYTPEDRAAGAHVGELDQARTEGSAPDVRWHLHQDGRRVFIEGHTTALRDDNDRLTGFLKIGQDVTERRQSEAALRESEQRFRLFVENVQEYALFQADPEGRVTSWNPGAERLFAYTTEEMLGQSVDTLLTPEDKEAEVFAKELRRVFAGEHAEDARWLVRKNGSRFWAQWVTEPVHDEAGKLRGVAKILRDETERKKAQDRQRLLIGELNHRVKNTLASVQAIASQTLRSSIDPETFASLFQGRIQALAQAHNLLTRVSWEAADIRDILLDQLALDGDELRVSLDGPPALLPANSALALSLVLHELGTNARKYGALSVPEGSLSITWRVTDTEEGPVLHLVWAEQGGPPVSPPTKQGFGTILIRHSLLGVGGETELQFFARGLRCNIDLPLTSEALKN